MLCSGNPASPNCLRSNCKINKNKKAKKAIGKRYIYQFCREQGSLLDMINTPIVRSFLKEIEKEKKKKREKK